ncbi:MAG: hypothetical protein PHV59_00050 [Victivallales bacterium]|nr:hypothetical protein [Victivallales bacterium]
MDFTFLADKIKTQLLNLQPYTQPLCVIRGSGGFNGEPGESYVIVYPAAVYLYGRKFSAPDFETETVIPAVLRDLALERQPFSAVLSIRTADKMIKLKISAAEIQNAELLLEYFKIRSAAGTDAGDHKDDEKSLPPLVGLVAVLMFIAAIDRDIAATEQEFITRFCGGDDQLYNSAYECYQKKTFEEVVAALQLDEQQKMCYLANILDLAMVDGVYDCREQDMIKAFTDAVKLPEAEIRTIEQVLLIKNQLSVL